MKSERDALNKALRLSKKLGKEFFVVFSADEYDIPGNNYHVCNDFGLDSFYQGCEVLHSSYDYI
jgi:hypothetical protein